MSNKRTITAGQYKAMLRSGVVRECHGCSHKFSKYVGRYPKSCPNCGDVVGEPLEDNAPSVSEVVGEAIEAIQKGALASLIVENITNRIGSFQVTS